VFGSGVCGEVIYYYLLILLFNFTVSLSSLSSLCCCGLDCYSFWCCYVLYVSVSIGAGVWIRVWVLL